MSGALLWTRAYRFIGMDPADIERRTEDGILAYGACLWAQNLACIEKESEDGISPTDNMKTQTLSARIRKSLSDEHGHGHRSLDVQIAELPVGETDYRGNKPTNIIAGASAPKPRRPKITQTLAFPRRRGLLSRLIQKSTAAQAHPRGRGAFYPHRTLFRTGPRPIVGGSCVYRQANSTS